MQTTLASSTHSTSVAVKSRPIPRPWLINLYARALRLEAGTGRTVSITPDRASGLTHSTNTSFWNAIYAMEARGWLERDSGFMSASATIANSYRFTGSFPFEAIPEWLRTLMFEISAWPGELEPRDIAILWRIAAHGHRQRHRKCAVSRRTLMHEMEWSSLSNRDRRSVPLGKRLKSLALRDRLRILRRKTEAGKWKENGYQLAGPSGFIRDGEPIEGPAPEPANELRETLVELFRVNCSVEWWYVTFDQIGARVGRTKKAVQFQIRRLERDGLLRISPKDESQGRYTNGYLYVGPAATDALKQRKHEAAVAAGRDVLKYCNLVADLPYEGPSPYPTYPAAYKSGSKSDGNYIRKEKSRALTNRWGS